jgi:hypothetical protein
MEKKETNICPHKVDLYIQICEVCEEPQIKEHKELTEKAFLKRTIKRNDKILKKMDDDYGFEFEDYDEYRETKEMEITLKALKVTFWFFVWSASFIIGLVIGKEFF